MLNSTLLEGSASIEYLRLTEYYKDREGNDIAPMVWGGKGLSALGLNQGTAKDRDFVSLAKGYGPDGNALVQNAGDEKRRIGMEWMFSADASISEAMAIATPEMRDKIIAGWHESVDLAMNFLESKAEARRDKAGQKVEQVDGLIWARVTHFCNRNLEPNLHCHVLNMNVAPRTDGTFGAVSYDWMLEYKKAASALCRAHMASKMQELGFGITKVVERDDRGNETGDVFFRLSGMSDEWRGMVATRRQQIVAYAAEHGTTLQQAALASRKKKDEPTFAECLEIWQATYEKLKDDGIALNMEHWMHYGDQVEATTDAKTMDKLTQGQAVFTNSELIAHLAQENVGILDLPACLVEAQRFITEQKAAGQVFDIKPVVATHAHQISGRHTELRMTTKEFVTLEAEAVNSAAQRKDDQVVRIDPELTRQAIAAFEDKHGFSMSDEQRQAVEHLTHGSGGTAILEGRAGTGKTTVSEAVVQSFQSAGRTVIGVAEGWDAAKKLEAEAGITSHSSAHLLQEIRAGRITLSHRDVLMVDEAGMVGTRNIRSFQRLADEAGAKLILMGDAKQLQPISAGGIFRLLKQEVGAATLSNIRRQQSTQDVATANLLYKDAGLAFKAMQANGQVKSFDTTQEAMAELVQGYVTSKAPNHEKLILVGTLGEGKHLTKILRAELRERGQLQGTAFKFKALTGRWNETIDVQKGDRIRFTKKDMGLGVVNGTSGIVKDVDGRYITLAIQSDIAKENGKIVKLDTWRNRCFAHDWTRTVHKSQGQGKEEVHMLASPKMTDNHSALVGFTRMKQKFTLYGSHEDIAAFGRKLGVERLKENAIEGLAEVTDFQATKERLQKRLSERNPPGYQPAIQQPPRQKRGLER